MHAGSQTTLLHHLGIKRSVRTNSKPSLNKNLVTAMAEVTVIFILLNVCLLINIRPLSSFEKSP